MRDFGCLKDKYREKDKGEGRGRCGGRRDFLYFFGLFFWGLEEEEDNL